jgi:hypothetical protein
MTSSAHIPPIVTRSTKLCNRAGSEETIHEDTLAKVFGAVVTFCSPLTVTRGRSRSRFSVSYAITDGRMQRSPFGSPSYALRATSSAGLPALSLSCMIKDVVLRIVRFTQCPALDIRVSSDSVSGSERLFPLFFSSSMGLRGRLIPSRRTFLSSGASAARPSGIIMQNERASDESVLT